MKRKILATKNDHDPDPPRAYPATAARAVHQKWQKMAKNGQKMAKKWQKMAKNGQKMAKNGQKWPKMGVFWQNPEKWPKMAKTVKEKVLFLAIFGIFPKGIAFGKWPKMAKNGTFWGLPGRGQNL